MAQVRVRAVGIDVGPDTPVLLLEEIGGAGRVVPVSVGGPEATALVVALERVHGVRPDTHRLIGELLTTFGRQLVQVRVHTLAEGIFHAELMLDDGTTVDSRTSDAVVLALWAGAGIQVDEDVLVAAGVAAETVTIEGAGRAGADAEIEEELRRFLDTATPDDFGPDPQD
ncbi:MULTISPECIES: bifunctional nuclease family protein [unclassified Pseudonocardia]|uniref:bifunctional nuclease family protein n=1 Tax=unclassified Pseudonocardia TaxID=2619320 RepID=UPI0001FFE220|nr:bifunctional nuclease family protein [Pseudonocardia sp. Ae707_Ps1]OLM16336.1 hypothetical protein Ae707Ps1_0594 [Pseudonocardia sp. Ae707_Ps1]